MMKKQKMTVRQRLLKEFSCKICREVMTAPVTTPCAHLFCKSCLEDAFVGKSFVTERSRGGRSLRARKNVMKCPACPTDISDFLKNPQVNTEIKSMIESLKALNEEEEKVDPTEESSDEEDEDPTEDSSEEDDSDNEATDPVSDETGVNGNGQTSGTKSPTRSPKRVKVDAGNYSSKTDDDGEAKEIFGPQTDGSKGDPKESKSDAPVAKCERKPAGQVSAGAKSRGRKRTKEESSGDEKGNGSPANPLQVQSDENPKESKKPAAKHGRRPGGASERFNIHKPSFRNISRRDGRDSSYIARAHDSLLRKVLRGEKYLKLYIYHYLINGVAVLLPKIRLISFLGGEKQQMWFWTFLLELQPPILLSSWVYHKEHGFKEEDMNQLEKGVVIGFIDTGTDPTHISFADHASERPYPVPAHFCGICEVTPDFHLGPAIGSLLQPAILHHPL